MIAYNKSGLIIDPPHPLTKDLFPDSSRQTVVPNK